MKKLLLILLFLLPVLCSAQVIRFMGRYDVSAVDYVNDSTWTLTGTFVDNTGSYNGLNADTNNKVVQRGYNVDGIIVYDRYKVVGVISQTTTDLVVNVRSDFTGGIQNIMGTPYTGAFPIATPVSDTSHLTYLADLIMDGIDVDYFYALINLNLYETKAAINPSTDTSLLVHKTTIISTTSPLMGGGDFSINRTHYLNTDTLIYWRNKQNGFMVNVVDYGADSTGHTDCTTAIQNALDAVPIKGAIVFFPAGKYKTVGGLTINYNTTILGANGNFSVDFTGTPHFDTVGSVILCTSATNNLFTVNSSGCQFQNIALINTSITTPSAGASIYLDNAGTLKIHDCTIDGFWNNIDLINGLYWNISASSFVNPVNYNLYIHSPSYPDWGCNSLTTSYFQASALTVANIRYESSGALKISDCYFGGVAGHYPSAHIDAEIKGGTQQLQIDNCAFEAFYDYGIHVYTYGSASYAVVSITNNWLCSYHKVTGNYIKIKGNIQGVVISNNTLGDYSFGNIYGIAADSVTNISILGNVYTNGWTKTRMKLTNCIDVDTLIYSAMWNTVVAKQDSVDNPWMFLNNSIVQRLPNDSVSLGGTKAYYPVDITRNVRIQGTNKLLFGGTGAGDADTKANLYRFTTDGATNQLVTDGSFRVGEDLYVIGEVHVFENIKILNIAGDDWLGFAIRDIYGHTEAVVNLDNIGNLSMADTLKIGKKIVKSGAADSCLMRDPADSIIKMRVLPTVPPVTPATVTAGSNKISLGGTPTGAVLQAFSIDVNQGNIDHNSLLNYVATKHFYQKDINYDSLMNKPAIHDTAYTRIYQGTGILVTGSAPNFTIKADTALVETKTLATSQLATKLNRLNAITDGYIPYQSASTHAFVDGPFFTDGTNVILGAATTPRSNLEIQGTMGMTTSSAMGAYWKIKPYSTNSSFGIGYFNVAASNDWYPTAGTPAIKLTYDGTLSVLAAYTTTVGVTNKPLFIDDAGLIGTQTPFTINDSVTIWHGMHKYQSEVTLDDDQTITFFAEASGNGTIYAHSCGGTPGYAFASFDFTNLGVVNLHSISTNAAAADTDAKLDLYFDDYHHLIIKNRLGAVAKLIIDINYETDICY